MPHDYEVRFLLETKTDYPVSENGLENFCLNKDTKAPEKPWKTTYCQLSKDTYICFCWSFFLKKNFFEGGCNMSNNTPKIALQR